MRILQHVERELAQQYYQSLIGRKLEVLVEGHSRTRAGWVHGTDRRYVPVELPGLDADLGQIIIGRATRSEGHFLEATRETSTGSTP